MFLIGFPLLLVPFAIYNIVAFLMPGASWTGTLATVRMMSGADWAMSGGDMLVALAVLLLVMSFFDVVGGVTLALRARRREVIIAPAEPAPKPVEPAPPRVEPLPERTEPTLS